jgi:hypothetical protein
MKSILKKDDKGTTKGMTNVTPNDALKDDYISHLKEEIISLREQVKDFSVQFSNFQEIEKEAMARFKEQNHIIMQLEMIAEERLQKIERLTAKTQEEPIVSEKNETEEAEIVPEDQSTKEEEVVLTDYPDQVPGQTMIPIPEDKPELKEEVEVLSKSRQSTLKKAMDLNDLLNEGEKKAEARRKRIQERQEGK